VHVAAGTARPVITASYVPTDGGLAPLKSFDIFALYKFDYYYYYYYY